MSTFTRILFAALVTLLILGTPWTVDSLRIFARGVTVGVLCLWLVLDIVRYRAERKP